MAAYTDSTKIANYLGVTLTAGQITQAGVTAQAASDWIDRYIGRSWQDASPVTDELHQFVRDRVYLAHRPVLTVTSMATREQIAGGDWTTLGADEYELLDAANGVVLIQGWGTGGLTKTTYTYTTTVPTPVGLAATMIAASWLGPALVGLPSGLESVALGQNDINVKFSSSARDVPAEALTLLSSYRTVVVA
jgi:hypothetical protein